MIITTILTLVGIERSISVSIDDGLSGWCREQETGGYNFLYKLFRFIGAIFSFGLIVPLGIISVLIGIVCYGIAILIRKYVYKNIYFIT